MHDNAKYISGEPGLNEQAARWLTQNDVVAIGADNMAVEVLPGTNHPDSYDASSSTLPRRSRRTSY